MKAFIQKRHCKTSIAGLVVLAGSLLVIGSHLAAQLHDRTFAEYVQLMLSPVMRCYLFSELGTYLTFGGAAAIGLLAADGKLDN